MDDGDLWPWPEGALAPDMPLETIRLIRRNPLPTSEAYDEDPEPAISVTCQSPYAIQHAACPREPIFQAWNGKTISCKCWCHAEDFPCADEDDVAAGDRELTMASDKVLRPGLEPRETGFIASVLELRALMREHGILKEEGA